MFNKVPSSFGVLILFNFQSKLLNPYYPDDCIPNIGMCWQRATIKMKDNPSIKISHKKRTHEIFKIKIYIYLILPNFVRYDELCLFGRTFYTGSAVSVQNAIALLKKELLEKPVQTLFLFLSQNQRFIFILIILHLFLQAQPQPIQVL